MFMLVLTLLISFSSFAANTVGNGGDVVVCDDGGVTTLDLFEGKVLRGFDTDLLDADYTVNLNSLLTRWESLDPMAAAYFRAGVATFMQETRFIEDAGLKDIPDSDESIIPENCKIKQAAIQKEPTLPHDKRFLIDKAIWNSLNGTGKASLVMHELIYRAAIERGHTNSIFTRYLNSYLFAPESATAPTLYREAMHKGNFPISFAVTGESGRLYIFNTQYSWDPEMHQCFGKYKGDQLKVLEAGSVELGDLFPAINAVVGTNSVRAYFKNLYRQMADFFHNFVEVNSENDDSWGEKKFRDPDENSLWICVKK